MLLSYTMLTCIIIMRNVSYLGKLCISLMVSERCCLIYLVFQVSIIQPGNFGAATNILSKKTSQDIWNEFDGARKLTFSQKYVEMACDYFQSTCTLGFKNCTMVIDAMLHALTSAKPRSRYLLACSLDWCFFYVYPFLPTYITDAVFNLSSMYHKREVMLYS